MSYQQPARQRRPQPSSSSVIVTGAVLAILAMVAVIAIGRQHSRDATPPWLSPPQAPIPMLSLPPAPSATPSTAAAATLSPLPVSRRSTPASPSASPRPSRTTARMLPEPGTSVSLLASGSTNLRLRHQDFRIRLATIDPGSPSLARADSSFILRRGLLDARCISLESVNYPGWFMRHQNFVLRLQARQQSPLYAADATFCPQRAGPDADFLLRSVNFPDRYLAARDAQVLLSPAPATSAQRFRATPGLPLDAGAQR